MSAKGRPITARQYITNGRPAQHRPFVITTPVRRDPRPSRDIRNVRISEARLDIPGSGVPDVFLSYSCPRFSASHDQSADAEALPGAGKLRLESGRSLSTAMRAAADSPSAT